MEQLKNKVLENFRNKNTDNINKKIWYTNVNGSIIYNCQNVEATQFSINTWMNK
jgi:hypothetical protein